MKFLFWCLISAFLAGICSNLYAQTTPAAIRGKVLTENHTPAEASTVILLKLADSSMVSSAKADKNGIYQFTEVNPGNYILSATCVGYAKAYTNPFVISAGETLIMGEISLTSSTKQLNEVSVAGTKPAVDVKPGNTTLNIQNSLTAAGRSAFDILRQSPGVRVDNNENFSIVGRQNALITIDGKPTNLSGEDLAGVLKSIQSNTIDRIELITSGSAKYDASAGGIINIVLKKGENTGANGSVTGSLGYGRYFKGSTGIVFNDRTNKFNIFGSYNFSANKTFHDFTTDRIINFDNLVSNYHVDYNSVQKSYGNNFSLGTDYFISSGQTIGFLINGYTRSDNFVKNNSLKISNQSVLDSIITANSDLNRDVTSINYNLNYNGKLDNAGKTLTADFDYTTYRRSSAEYIINTFYETPSRIPDTLQNLSPSSIRIWLARVDFNDPLSKTSTLEAGIKYSNASSNNNVIFGPAVNGVYQSNPAFSNHFVYTENVNSAYVNYVTKINRLSITAGLRAEQTIATGNSITSGHVVNSNYVDLFPQVQLIYRKDDKNDFSLSYNRGIQRPLYTDINPFLYYVDLYDFRTGNPNLKPEYSNSIELSYNYNKTFLFSLYNTIISNAVVADFYQQNDSTKVNVTTQKNFGTIYNIGVRVYAPVIFTSWWNADFSLDGSYLRYVAYPENGDLNKGTQAIIFSTTQYFVISKTISAELSGNYVSPNFDGISQYKANYYINAGIGKQLFKNRGSLKLSATDIFNTQRERGYTDYQNLDLTSTIKRETQVVRLTFTYHFGKTSVKNTSAHHTGNEDEQKRTGLGGEN